MNLISWHQPRRTPSACCRREPSWSGWSWCQRSLPRWSPPPRPRWWPRPRPSPGPITDGDGGHVTSVWTNHSSPGCLAASPSCPPSPPRTGRTWGCSPLPLCSWPGRRRPAAAGAGAAFLSSGCSGVFLRSAALSRRYLAIRHENKLCQAKTSQIKLTLLLYLLHSRNGFTQYIYSIYPLEMETCRFSHLECVENSLKQAFYMFYIDILICDKNMWEVNVVFSDYTITQWRLLSNKLWITLCMFLYFFISTSINCRLSSVDK